jgi:hypothetical protein
MGHLLIDAQTFEDVQKSFVLTEQSEESFDWDAFLTILLDFGIFVLSLQSLTMSYLFDTITEFEQGKNTSQIVFLLSYAIHVTEFWDSHKMSFLTLLGWFQLKFKFKFKLKLNTLLRMIATLPEFTTVLAVLTFPDGCDDSSSITLLCMPSTSSLIHRSNNSISYTFCHLT